MRYFSSFFLGIYVVYFLLWLKKTLWEWLLFYLKERNEIKAFYLDHFKKCNYPEPDEYINSGSDYILEVSEDKSNDAELRVAAAAISGMLSGMRLLGHFQRFLRVSFSIDDAIEEYKKTFPPKSEEN